jgi:hypothetical protein
VRAHQQTAGRAASRGGVAKIHRTFIPWAMSASPSRRDLCGIGEGGEYQGGYDWTRRSPWLKSSFNPLNNGGGGGLACDEDNVL